MKAALQDVTVDSRLEMNKEKSRLLHEIQQHIDSGRSDLNKQIQRGIKRIRKESDTQEKRLKQATVDDYTARKNGLRQKLIDYLKKDCRTISISPFLEEEQISLLSFYVTPVMQLREHHLAKDESPVESYKDIFAKGGIRYKHIYITGEAGVGKTTLCRRMALLWALSKCSKLQNYRAVDKNDMNTMKYFEFLFYVNLRETTMCRIEDIIHQQLFDDESDKKFLQQVLEKEKCLVILDGLHEWLHSTTCKDRQKYKVPHCRAYGKCTFVTISRPYRLESLRLKSSEIDREVVITGMDTDSQISFVSRVVKRLDRNKDPYKFLQDVDTYNMTDLLEIPITAAHLVCLWIDNKLGNFTRSHLFGTILENMFNRAIKSQLPHHDQRVQERPRNPVRKAKIKCIIPECLKKIQHIQEHMNTLSKLFHLAFDSLFSLGDNSVSYSNSDLEKYQLTREDVELLCLVGIFSKRKAIGYLTERRYKISFLHTVYQEYMAALYMHIAMERKDFQNTQEKIKQVCNTYANMKRFANVFVLLAAIDPQLLEKLLVHIDEAIWTDESAIAFREHSCSNMYVFISHRKQQINYEIEAFQDTVIKCCEASASHGISLSIRDIFIYKNNIKQISKLLSSCWKGVKSIFLTTWNSELKHSLAKLNDLQKLEVRYIDSEFHEIVDIMVNCKTVLKNLFVSYCAITRCIPFNELSCLRSLYLHNVKMQHNCLTELLRYMSSELRLSQIGLDDVKCMNHEDCSRIGRLDLSKHPKMYLLGLSDVRVSRVLVDPAKLERLKLDCKNHINVIWMQPFMTSLVNAPFLKKVVIYSVKDPELVGHLVQTLASLKSLRFMYLLNVNFYNNQLEIHKDVKDVEVEMSHIEISEQGFERFLDSIEECDTRICVHVQFLTIGAPSDDEKHVANIIEQRKHLRIHRLTDVSMKFCNDG